MIKEWYTEAVIGGKKYRIYHEEWSGYGGSTRRSSRMELIENESQKDTKVTISKNKEQVFERKEE